jgi:archaellum component FlaG (FlaF/FlaG flagellin family)
MPNAIMIGYHGPANGSDPYSYFTGNSIIEMFNVPFWPSGAVDRTGAPGDRNSWASVMNNRNSIPATVGIDVTRIFNPNTGLINANVTVTALENLTGEYRMTMILLEDGLVHSQAGNSSCPGNSNYVHNHVVRAILNGETGEDLNGGAAWNSGEQISKNIQYIAQSNIVADNSHLVVLVNKVQEEFYNSEIQQAVKLVLPDPNYIADVNTKESFYLGAPTDTATYSAYIKNIGLMPDTYNISFDINGPAGWSLTFTTINGTFNHGEPDSVALNPGDSTSVEIRVTANTEIGYGRITLSALSSLGSGGTVLFKFTTFGLNVLVVDDDGGEPYEEYITHELETLSYEYGLITSNFIPSNAENLTSFNHIIWNCADSEPTINTDEMNALITFLDNGGNLYLNGVDIAYELADPTSPYYSSETENFFTNFLHSLYILKEHSSTVARSIDGDPITGGLGLVLLTGGTGASTINHTAGNYVNQIAAAGPGSANILAFFGKPNDHPGIRAVHNGSIGDGAVVFTTFGFETIAKAEIRTDFINNILNWLDSPTGIGSGGLHSVPGQYSLNQNYPNPFNPNTIITYQIPESEFVRLKIYDVMGQEIAVLVNEEQIAGIYSVEFDASDLSSGIYFYTLTAGKFNKSIKMMLMK